MSDFIYICGGNTVMSLQNVKIPSVTIFIATILSYISNYSLHVNGPNSTLSITTIGEVELSEENPLKDPSM